MKCLNGDVIGDIPHYDGFNFRNNSILFNKVLYLGLLDLTSHEKNINHDVITIHDHSWNILTINYSVQVKLVSVMMSHNYLIRFCRNSSMGF